MLDGLRTQIRLDASWRAAAVVGVVLAASLALTGSASSAYHRARIAYGQEHFAAGQRLLAQQHTDAAIEEIRKALVFLPAQTEYRLTLATALVQTGQLAEAQSHLEQLSDENPTNPLIFMELARIAARQKKLTLAIQDYQHSVYEYWPPDLLATRRQARWELVGLLAYKGRRNEAVGELMQLYANTPGPQKEFSRVGTLLLQYGATSEASRVFNEAVKAKPQDAAARRGLAQVDLANSDFIAARHDFQKAVRLSPNDKESVAGLQLTNAVIDVDASLPGISATERIRRSENLLRRILGDLSACAFPDKDAAQELLGGKRKAGEDVGYELQQAAQKLWRERLANCGNGAPGDAAVDLVLARAVSGE